jgi:dihydropteroate synthase
MGVLNLTPDSFSDGGCWLDPDQAVEHALQMEAAGAAILDLGAESTRPGGGVYGPGARQVSPEEEADRLLPVLERLRPLSESVLSVDTRKGAVARQALAAGADLINDVSALADPEMVSTVAEAGCPIVLMHSRGDLATMQSGIAYDNLLGEVRAELSQAVERAVAGGIADRQTILDPGIGFGKTYDQNLELIGRLSSLAALGRPLLVGASRKSFIGHVTGAAASERLGGSLAAAAWACHQNAAILRVHDVRETVELIEVWAAVEQARRQEVSP